MAPHTTYSVWPNALAFDPDRWLTGEPEPSPFKYIAFNAGLAGCGESMRWLMMMHAGPRTCLGQRMAYVETEILTAMILQHFKVVASPGGGWLLLLGCVA